MNILQKETHKRQGKASCGSPRPVEHIGIENIWTGCLGGEGAEGRTSRGNEKLVNIHQHHPWLVWCVGEAAEEAVVERVRLISGYSLMYACIHTHRYECVHVCACVYVAISHMYIGMYIHIGMFVHTYRYIHTHRYACVRVCM